MRPYIRYIRTYEIRFSKWSSRGLVAVVPPLYRRCNAVVPAFSWRQERRYNKNDSAPPAAGRRLLARHSRSSSHSFVRLLGDLMIMAAWHDIGRSTSCDDISSLSVPGSDGSHILIQGFGCATDLCSIVHIIAYTIRITLQL